MSILIETLKGKKTSTPIWLMRQAGRHLPEYRELRKRSGDLMQMFLSEDIITRVTLHPVERYNIDAAILFSDILMVPYSLGANLSFQEGGIGPVVKLVELDNKLKQDLNLLKPVFNGITKIKKETENKIPLIGFVGGVWTTIYFSIFNKEERKNINKELLANKKNEIQKLINIFTEATINYALEQINLGVDAFQIFESAAGVLDDEQFDSWCLEPSQKILKAINNRVPVIGFPRGASLKSYIKFSNLKNISAISLDEKFKLSNINRLNQSIAYQGNLDPRLLLGEQEKLLLKTEDILLAFKDYPHIFNLGHGVLPTTPVENVEAMIDKVRKFK